MTEILKKLLRNYYICYILLVASAFAGFYLARYFRVQDPAEVQTFTTIGIVLLLASIPYSFHYYKKCIEKLKAQSEEVQFKEIVKVVSIRLAIVVVPLMFNIVFFYLTANVSLIFAAGMSALVLLYIKPSEKIFTKDLADENDNITNEETTEEK